MRNLAVLDEHFELWNQAAAHSGIEVGEWVHATLDAAARKVITAVPAPAAIEQGESGVPALESEHESMYAA